MLVILKRIAIFKKCKMMKRNNFEILALKCIPRKITFCIFLNSLTMIKAAKQFDLHPSNHLIHL